MSMLLRNLLLVLGVVSFGSAWANVEAVIGPVPLQQNDNLAFALPQSQNSEIMISRDQYLISYNKNRRAPNWVAWKLTSEQLGSVHRSNHFEQDQELEQYLTQNGGGFHAVQPEDYKKSCFDRGHQVPSGDRTDSTTDNGLTFEMSNMIPQTPYLNRVIWEHLENYARSLVSHEGKKLYIIAGPIYDANFGAIGPQKDIPVPSKDFKIIFVLDVNQSASDISADTQHIAVIMPNSLKGGQAPRAYAENCGGSTEEAASSQNDDWKTYQTTLAEIESKAGLSFTGLSSN
jgi:endonuclease G